MISDEKMTHIVHLLIDGIEKKGLVTYPSKERALHEAKLAGIQELKKLGGAEEQARQRILSQKNPPPEHSPQWDVLFNKYLEEALQRRGG